jgi:hypothetical protein
LYLQWPLDGLSQRVSEPAPSRNNTHFLARLSSLQAFIHLLFPRLDFVSSLVISACLTPTDPIISAAVIGQCLRLWTVFVTHSDVPSLKVGNLLSKTYPSEFANFSWQSQLPTMDSHTLSSALQCTSQLRVRVKQLSKNGLLSAGYVSRWSTLFFCWL